MITISQTAEYALRAVVCMARSQTPLTSRRLAELAGAPVSYLQKVLKLLVHARLARSQRGKGGGFQLARQPEKISVLEVINAVNLVHPASPRCSFNPRARGDPLRLLYHQLSEAAVKMERFLGDLVISDLIEPKSIESIPSNLDERPLA
jgi:Rrf2 family protein